MTYSPLHSSGGGEDRWLFHVGRDTIDPAGKPVWKIKISSKEFAGNTVFSDDLAVVLVEPDTIAGIRLSDGEEVWRVEEPTCRESRQYSAGAEFRARDGKILVMGHEGYAELDASTGEQLAFQDCDDHPQPPEGLPWKFGYLGTTVIGDWEYSSRHWIHRQTGEVREVHPEAEHPTDPDLMDRYSGEMSGWIGARVQKHPECLEEDEARCQASAVDLKRGEVLWTKDFDRQRDKVASSEGYCVAGDVLVVGLEFWPGHPNSPRRSVILDLATGKELWCLEEGAGDMRETQTFWPSRVNDHADLEAEEGLLIKRGRALETRHRRTGELIWTTAEELPFILQTSSARPNGVFPFARAGRTLWVLYRYTEESKRKSASGKDLKPSDRGELVSLDYLTGKILHRQKVPRTATLVGQHEGCLLVRHGSTLTCYR